MAKRFTDTDKWKRPWFNDLPIEAKKECTPESVQAAVNCADKIVDILRLHLDVERLKIKRGGI